MQRTILVVLLAIFAVWVKAVPVIPRAPLPVVSVDDQADCDALSLVSNLTITHAGLAETESGVPYCYVKGILAPAIQFHVQLPLPEHWNGRFLKWGDGGKDGDLDFADHRVAAGYAVANSNTGHDNGAEPGSSFAYNNRQAEIDFGYRAVHLTTMAAKTLIRSYYDELPRYSYFEGCSTGGRQGLMEAQRYPDDFDGIVAGAPANHYQEMNAVRVWLLQRMFRDNFSGVLAFDSDADGRFDSIRKLDLLAETVLSVCDSPDGIKDGIIENPTQCQFDPEQHLAAYKCSDDVDADECFTTAQIQTVKDFYSGPRDQQGRTIYAGKPVGSERQWAGLFIPYTGNNFAPGAVGLGGDHLNYLFYEEDPGVAPGDLLDPSRDVVPPEWAWWDFDIEDVSAGKGDVMKEITDAVNPDLTRFLVRNGSKLIIYHGWSDALVVARPTLEYYEDVIDTTFGGDTDLARDHARLFMAPGMNHCRGGSGPNTWDKLEPLVNWVEHGRAPDFLQATHSTDGVVDNERLICAYPAQSVYSGPAAGVENARNWRFENFSCQLEQ